MKQISAGVIIQNDNNQILGCIPFGKGNIFDIPKGCIDLNETALHAALRELKEETSIELKEEDIIYLGQFYYSNSKDLELFYHKGNYDITKLHCNSKFNYYDRIVPEMVGYKWVDVKDIQTSFYKSLAPILIQEIQKL